MYPPNFRGGGVIEATSLDSYLDGRPVTFIKLDVEGAEMEALKGAAETIKKYKPKLAVCVYHRKEDIFTIPQYIQQLVPEYKFHMRAHRAETTEFNLYCTVR